MSKFIQRIFWRAYITGMCLQKSKSFCFNETLMCWELLIKLHNKLMRKVSFRVKSIKNVKLRLMNIYSFFRNTYLPLICRFKTQCCHVYHNRTVTELIKTIISQRNFFFQTDEKRKKLFFKMWLQITSMEFDLIRTSKSMLYTIVCTSCGNFWQNMHDIGMVNDLLPNAHRWCSYKMFFFIFIFFIV